MGWYSFLPFLALKSQTHSSTICIMCHPLCSSEHLKKCFDNVFSFFPNVVVQSTVTESAFQGPLHKNTRQREWVLHTNMLFMVMHRFSASYSVQILYSVGRCFYRHSPWAWVAFGQLRGKCVSGRELPCIQSGVGLSEKNENTLFELNKPPHWVRLQQSVPGSVSPDMSLCVCSTQLRGFSITEEKTHTALSG